MFGLMTGLWFMTNMVVIVLARRLASTLGLPADAVSLVMGWAAVAQAVFMAVTGHRGQLDIPWTPEFGLPLTFNARPSIT